MPSQLRCQRNSPFSREGNVPCPPAETKVSMVKLYLAAHEYRRKRTITPRSPPFPPTKQTFSCCSVFLPLRLALAFQHGWIHHSNKSGEKRLVSSPKVLDKADHGRVVASMKNFALYSKVRACLLALRAGVCCVRLKGALGRGLLTRLRGSSHRRSWSINRRFSLTGTFGVSVTHTPPQSTSICHHGFI